MKKEFWISVGKKMIPYFIFPTAIGIISGVLIFLFKITSTFIMHKSEMIYGYVRENPRYLPLLILGVCILGGIAALILKFAKECRGGGIPSAVAAIRGLIPMKWVECLAGLFGSAMLSFFAGVPLGNEGPSVQMGAAVGKGASRLFGKRYKALERYNMTGGASAGFAIATGSPISGIVFALEEMHMRFSPSIFVIAAVSVISGKAMSDLLCAKTGIDTKFLGFEIDKILPLKYIWIAVLIGLICGICANLLTNIYRITRKFANNHLNKIPKSLKIILIFVLVGIFGFVDGSFIGSGHSLIEEILSRHAVWYVILLAFFVRSMLMIVANNSGISGGMFVPTLALGAIITSLVSDGLIALGAIDDDYYSILVIIGIASFLAASSKIPLTALTFAAEALCVVSNLLPVAAGVVVSYLVVEVLGVPSFADTVIKSKVESLCEGKTAVVVDSHMTVHKGAFAIGMEVRDILWPPTCVILSIDKQIIGSHHSGLIEEGDVLHLHYRTYDRDDTMRALVCILGEQTEEKIINSYEAHDNHFVPGDR